MSLMFSFVFKMFFFSCFLSEPPLEGVAFDWLSTYEWQLPEVFSKFLSNKFVLKVFMFRVICSPVSQDPIKQFYSCSKVDFLIFANLTGSIDWLTGVGSMPKYCFLTTLPTFFLSRYAFAALVIKQAACLPVMVFEFWLVLYR